MIRRLRTWWQLRRARRAYRRTAHQIGLMLSILDQNPRVRKKFRQTLRVRGYEG